MYQSLEIQVQSSRHNRRSLWRLKEENLLLGRQLDWLMGGTPMGLAGAKCDKGQVVAPIVRIALTDCGIELHKSGDFALTIFIYRQ